MRFLNSDFWVLAVSAIVLPTFSFLLYDDFTSERRSGKEKIVGKITFVNNVGQRKYSRQVVWYDLKNDSPLYNKDTVRTEEQSEAVIKLKDGTSLEISENSMIYLDFSSEGINIDFSYGSIQAKKGAGKDGKSQKLIIKSKDKVITVDQGDLKVSKKENQDLNLIVKKGTVKINVGGKERTVKKDERALLSKDTVELKKIVLSPLTPPDNKRLIAFGKKINILFSWKKLEKANSVNIEISKDNRFKRRVLKKTTNINSTIFALGKGMYYWKISTQDSKSKKRIYSDTRSFTILQDSKLVLIGPGQDRSYYFFDIPPIVNFSWSENFLASGYILEISKDAQFKKIHKSVESRMNYIALSKFEVGKYFWRVKSKSNVLEIKSQISPIRSFNLTRKKAIDPPNPVNPQNNRGISQLIFNKDGVVFNWLKNKELKQTNFSIATSPDFKKIIYKKTSSMNYLILKKSLAKGKYYWRLQAQTAKGEKTKFSGIRSFRVIDLKKLTLHKPGNRKNFEYFSAKNNGITFIWKRPETYGKFLLELSKSDTFASTIISKKVLSYSSNISNLSPGTYFWRVSLLAKDEKKIIKSDARKFEIASPLSDPIAIFPKYGSTIEMANKNSLKFRWKAPKGANRYLFELYDSTNWIMRKLSLLTNKNYYVLRKLSLLDVGKFYWTCKAFTMNKKGKIIRSSAKMRTDFHIKLTERIKKPKIETPKIQFVTE